MARLARYPAIGAEPMSPQSTAYHVRLVEGLTPCFVVEREGFGALVSVALPTYEPRYEDVREERRQLAEAIARMLNGSLTL